MKHYYILLSFFFTSLNLLAQGGQLINRGFESWTTQQIYEQPNQWFSSNESGLGMPLVVKSTDAQLGTYSAQCYSPGADLGFAYFGLGELTAGPSGGIPYTADVNTLKFMYKSDFEAGDSIYVYIIRYLGGTQVGEYLSTPVFGTHSAWTQASVTIPAGTQDEIFIAFLTGSPNEDFGNSAGSFFKIDNVQLFNGAMQTAALPNFSLENWTAVSVENPSDWYTFNGVTAGFGAAGTEKTTDAHSGTYAAELTSRYLDELMFTIPGTLSVGPFSDNGDALVPYTAAPTVLSGWYKFAPSADGDDFPYVEISFFSEGQSIGGADFDFEANSTYTEFTLPLTIPGTPDSMSLQFFSGENDGAVLKLDDLSLSGGTVGLDQFAISSLSIYPNPATDNVMIKAEGNYSWEIVTLSGTVVKGGSSVSGAQEISLAGINAGTYFVRFNGESATGIHKLIVQ